jgi:hypothetical protein
MWHGTMRELNLVDFPSFVVTRILGRGDGDHASRLVNHKDELGCHESWRSLSLHLLFAFVLNTEG